MNETTGYANYTNVNMIRFWSQHNYLNFHMTVFFFLTFYSQLSVLNKFKF